MQKSIIDAGFDYWNSARGEAEMPRWSDIDPSAIPLLLPNIVVIHVQNEPLDFVDRIVGQTVRDHALRNTVNVPWSQIPGRGPDSQIWEMFRNVVEKGTCQHRVLQNVGRTSQHVTIKSLPCPISDDGQTVNRIIGFIDFLTSPGVGDAGDWTSDDENNRD